MDEDDAIPVEPYLPFPSFAEWEQNSAFNSGLVRRYSSFLEGTKASVTEENMARAIKSAAQWASVDTGALEGLYEVDRGFTYSVAAEAAAWDRIHLARGEDVARAINDAMAGYELVLDVATNSKPVTETLIKELHATICAGQETYTVRTAVGEQQHKLPLAQYKQYPNNPYNLERGAIHSYAPVAEVASEMHRLVDELNSDGFLQAEPVLQSAYAHYAFVCIHPFADGNGRVARALASIYLYRNPGIPLVIFADQKAGYLDALEAADAGDFNPLNQFLADRLIDTIGLVRVEMTRRHRKSLAERKEEFSRVLTGRGGLSHVEYDTLADRLAALVSQALTAAATQDVMPPGMSASVRSQNRDMGNKIPDGYRQTPSQSGIALIGQSQPPASARYQKHFCVVVARPETPEPEFRILITETGEVLEEVLLRELHPATSETLNYRLRVFAEEQAGDMIESLARDAENALRTGGYIT